MKKICDQCHTAFPYHNCSLNQARSPWKFRQTYKKLVWVYLRALELCSGFHVINICIYFNGTEVPVTSCCVTLVLEGSFLRHETCKRHAISWKAGLCECFCDLPLHLLLNVLVKFCGLTINHISQILKWSIYFAHLLHKPSI